LLCKLWQIFRDPICKKKIKTIGYYGCIIMVIFQVGVGKKRKMKLAIFIVIGYDLLYFLNCLIVRTISLYAYNRRVAEAGVGETGGLLL